MNKKFIEMYNAKDIEELKKVFKKYALRYHPDMGGSTSDMQELNSIYAELHKVLLNSMDKESKEYKNASRDIPSEFTDIISKLIVIDGINIDIVGTWIWVSGDTYKHKEYIKSLGFRWSNSPERKAWYYTNDIFEYKKNYKKESFDKLKDRHGCISFKGKGNPMLNN